MVVLMVGGCENDWAEEGGDREKGSMLFEIQEVACLGHLSEKERKRMRMAGARKTRSYLRIVALRALKRPVRFSSLHR